MSLETLQWRLMKKVKKKRKKKRRCGLAVKGCGSISITNNIFVISY